MSNVFIDKTKIDNLANAISVKSGESVPMTLTEMTQAVDGIDTSGGGSAEPNLQSKTYTVDSAGTETITADVGYDGLSEVEVIVPSASVVDEDHASEFYYDGGTRKWHTRCWADYGSGGFIDGVQYGSYLVRNAVPSNTTVTPTTSAQTIGGANYMMEGAVTVSAMPTGTAGTPTAAKGAVSNHSVSVTPSVTNTTGYITGSTKTGTAVTVSASELVSGSETKTANGTYDVTNLASLVVNVSGGSSKNAQVVQGTTRTTSSTLTAIGAELTVSKTGTYNVYWSAFRSNTSSQYTFATKLYINGTGYGSEQTTWSNHQQNVHLSNVSLSANDKIRVYGRESRGSSYYMYAGTLTIIEA